MLVLAVALTASFLRPHMLKPGLCSAPMSAHPWQHAGAGAVSRARPRSRVAAGQWHGEAVFELLSNAEAGCVLVASPDEIDHFSRHAVVLVLSHGAQGSRGVTLEMATAFNVGEMAASLADSPFATLPLFRGGSAGKDQILMLHDVEGLGGSQPIGCVK